MLFSAADRERNRLSNAERIYRRYAPAEAHIDETVSHANSSMAERTRLADSLSRSPSRAERSPT